MVTYATSGLDYLVQLLRYRISDQKIVVTISKDEDLGAASGTPNEIFLTKKMPIASGSENYLYIDRWSYTRYDSDLLASGNRGYIFSTISGSYRIPSGAIPANAGDRVVATYSYEDPQAYKFTDKELQLYIGDSINAVNNDYNFGFMFVGTGTNYTVEPVPTMNDYASHLYVMYAGILIKTQLESEGFGDRIYLKDVNITIDTSKGLGDLGKSIKELRSQYDNAIADLLFISQEAAFSRIDTYNTRDLNECGQYNTTFMPEREYGQS